MAGSSRDVRRELGDAGFSADMIKANLRRLRKVLERTRWDPDGSTWSDYGRCEHVAAQRSVKEAFVRRVASERRRRLVWDLGANDGHYSRLVSGQADTVVAIDGDHLVMDRLYQRLRSDGPGNVLPLVVDLADPSPDLGWRGRERRSLEGRGKPDLVLALAVVHHLVVGSSLPLAEVLDWLRSLDAEVVLEWVPPHDPMAKRLTISKQEGEVHADYTEEALEALIGDRFRLRAESQVEGRRLLLLSPEG